MILVFGMENEFQHIAIDARMISDRNMHGIARYVFNLIMQLAEIDRSNRYTIFVSAGSPLFRESLPSSFLLVQLKSRFISLQEQFEIPKVLRAIKADLFHSPSFVAPLYCPCKLIMTIHDLNHIVLPQYYTLLHKLYWKFFVTQCIRRSSWILTVSQFSKRELVKYFNLDVNRIVVTYNSVSKSYYPIDDVDQLARIRKKYQLPEKFIFYVGNNKPHKNVVNLVRAYCKSKLEMALVVRCPVDRSLIDIAAEYNCQHKLHFARFIPDYDLPLALNAAHLFVYPSTYEGFGLPPLEAMACGTPVVVSNATSLPEVAGTSAIYVDPSDTDDIARGLHEGVLNEVRRDQLVALGSKRIKEFSWCKMATKTYDLYRTVLKENACE